MPGTTKQRPKYLNLVGERFSARHERSLDLEQAMLVKELLESDDHDL